MVALLRGQVRWVDLDPIVGHEQAGRRPALVVQNDVGNAASPTTIVAPISSRVPTRSYPFLVPVPAGVLPKESVVNCAQVRTIDRSRLAGGPIATLDAGTMELVDQALRVSLGLA